MCLSLYINKSNQSNMCKLEQSSSYGSGQEQRSEVSVRCALHHFDDVFSPLSVGGRCVSNCFLYFSHGLIHYIRGIYKVRFGFHAHADHTECDAMKSCTDAKCEQECQNKSTNLPIEPECTTPNECCCTFYREEHNVLHP